MAASVVDLPEPVGPVTSTTPFLSPAISFRTAGRLKSLHCGGRVGDDAHDDGVRAALHEDVDAEAREARRAEGEVGRAELLKILGGRPVAADDDLAMRGRVRGQELFEPGDGDGLQLAHQLDLRRAPGREDEVAHLVGDGEHPLEDVHEIQLRARPPRAARRGRKALGVCSSNLLRGLAAGSASRARGWRMRAGVPAGRNLLGLPLSKMTERVRDWQVGFFEPGGLAAARAAENFR